MRSLRNNLTTLKTSIRRRIDANKTSAALEVRRYNELVDSSAGSNILLNNPTRQQLILPVELWLEIAKWLEKSDLISLSNCSYLLRSTFLRSIFEDLPGSMFSTYQHRIDALNNWAKETHLFPLVHKFELSRKMLPFSNDNYLREDLQDWGGAIYHFLGEHLRQMGSLKHLKLAELELTQDLFETILAHPTLTHLSLCQVFMLRPYNLLSSKHLISHVTVLDITTWIDRPVELMVFLSQNLVELSLSVGYNDHGIHVYSGYLTYRCPNLQHFSLRGPASISPAPADTSLQRFLHLHPTITKASLLVPGGWSLPQAVLPRLRELVCNWRNLPDIAPQRLGLKRLTLCFDRLDGQPDHSFLQVLPHAIPENLQLICWVSAFKFLFMLPANFVVGLKHLTIHVRESKGLEIFQSNLRFEALTSVVLALDEATPTMHSLNAWLEGTLSPLCPALSTFEADKLVDEVERGFSYTVIVRIFVRIDNQWMAT